MIKRKIVIKSKAGLHARPATLVCKEAMKFKSEIRICKKSKDAIAKSILSVLTLGAEYGDEVELIVEGDDEQKALDCMTKVLETIY